MTHTAIPPGATIRARVHDSALKRVTKFWASRPIEIFIEALQNSRRAGATRVHVTISAPTGRPAGHTPEPSEPRLAVSITDDGAGIEDPAVLLSFGENGWNDELVAREDARGHGDSQPRAPRLSDRLAATHAGRPCRTWLVRRP